MNLPEGIPQNSACVLIAMREYFNDPTWEDADLVNDLRNGNTSDKVMARNGQVSGYDFQKMPALLERAGLFTHSSDDGITLHHPDGTNSDSFTVTIYKGVRYSFPRNAKCVFSYFTNKERTSGHAVCVPLHVAICLMVNVTYGWGHIGIDATDMQYLGVKRA